LLNLVGQARMPRPAVLALGMLETKQTLARRITGLRFAGAAKHVGAAGFVVAILAILTVVPWRLVAQTTEGDEIERLRKENEMLREQLAKAKPSAPEAEAGHVLGWKAESAWADQDRLDGLRLKLEEARAQLRDLSQKYTDLHPVMIEQRTKVEALDKQIAKLNQAGDLSLTRAKLARLTEELNRLLLRIPAEHPKTQELRAKIDKLQKQLPAAATNTSRQQALYQEELALAEEELAEVKDRLKKGIASQQELRSAERGVIQVKKDSALHSSSREKMKALLDQEIALAEEELAEARKRVELGLAPTGSERSLQREILKLKRQRVTVEEP
jgi:chromosome segregation ATPase